MQTTSTLGHEIGHNPISEFLWKNRYNILLIGGFATGVLAVEQFLIPPVVAAEPGTPTFPVGPGVTQPDNIIHVPNLKSVTHEAVETQFRGKVVVETPVTTDSVPEVVKVPSKKIIFESTNKLTSDDVSNIEKNSGNVSLGEVSPVLDKDKKLRATQLAVIPNKIYEAEGKYFCDCIIDRSLSIHTIEIGNVLTSNISVTDKKLPGELGISNETYSNKLASIVITPDKTFWSSDIEFNTDNMVNLALFGALKPKELRIILVR